GFQFTSQGMEQPDQGKRNASFYWLQPGDSKISKRLRYVKIIGIMDHTLPAGPGGMGSQCKQA
ncbi:MAG: hypothetical protein EBU49_06830, partial [Proteobacteria bacterium]|nr:hypothetical protein [Pseudomonadota bacterium]